MFEDLCVTPALGILNCANCGIDTFFCAGAPTCGTLCVGKLNFVETTRGAALAGLCCIGTLNFGNNTLGAARGAIGFCCALVGLCGDCLMAGNARPKVGNDDFCLNITFEPDFNIFDSATAAISGRNPYSNSCSCFLYLLLNPPPPLPGGILLPNSRGGNIDGGSIFGEGGIVIDGVILGDGVDVDIGDGVEMGVDTGVEIISEILEVIYCSLGDGVSLDNSEDG